MSVKIADYSFMIRDIKTWITRMNPHALPRIDMVIEEHHLKSTDEKTYNLIFDFWNCLSLGYPLETVLARSRDYLAHGLYDPKEDKDPTPE